MNAEPMRSSFECERRIYLENMAANGNHNNFSYYYEEPALEKLPACTMKRYPKMDLNKSDMLQLLSYLEGELQARDIVVATLNAEKVKQMTLRAKRHRAHPDDPLFALQRDSEVMRDCSFGEGEVKSMYDDQLNKLENLIGVQHAAQKNMREVLGLVEKKYHKMSTKLESDRRAHKKDIEQDEHIIRLLQKEKERLKEELEKERKRCRHLEEEARRFVVPSQHDAKINSDHDTLIAVQLIKEQTKMMRKMAELQSYAASLNSDIEEEKRKATSLERSITEETEKLMHEEAMQEKQLSEFDFERRQLFARLSKAEAQQKELLEELSKLHQPEGPNQAELPKSEQNGVKTTCQNSSTIAKFPPPVSTNQSQGNIKRPNSAQPVSSKLQPPFASRPQQTPRNFPPSLVPTLVSSSPPSQVGQQSRLRNSGNESNVNSTKMPSAPQNHQGPLVRRILSQGSKVPPPVPPNKPQVPSLPQVQQTSTSKFMK